MKISIAIAALTSSVTFGSALAQPQSLTYPEIVREARRYEKLELSERIVSNKVLLQKVRVDLKPFGGGSSDYYVKKSDEIGFICARTSPGFKGGSVTATITKHEEAEGGSHFYTLDNCTTAK